MNDLLDLILTPLGPISHDPISHDSGLADQVRQRFEATRHDENADELHALSEALHDYPDEYPPDWWLDPARCRWWLGVHADWKAYDEVAWQVQATARTLGLETGFESRAEAQWDGYFEYLKSLNGPAAQKKPPGISLLQRLKRSLRKVADGELLRPARPPPSDTPTMDVLSEASEWLRARGYELLFLETGGDEYLAVPVRLDLLERVRSVALRLDISTYLL